MKKTLIATAIMALAATSMTPTANAAPFVPNVQSAQTANIIEIGHKDRGYRERGYAKRHEYLSPRKIKRILRHRGYRNVRTIDFYRGKYIVRARGYRGPVRLVVSARTGEVLSRQRLGHYRHYGQRFGGHRNGWSWSFTLN